MKCRETETSEMDSNTNQISKNCNKESEVLWKTLKKRVEKSSLTNQLEFFEGANSLVDKRGPFDAWILTRHFTRSKVSS